MDVHHGKKNYCTNLVCIQYWNWDELEHSMLCECFEMCKFCEKQQQQNQATKKKNENLQTYQNLVSKFNKHI